MMSPTYLPLAGIILFILCAAWVLAPLAERIPARLERQWDIEVEEHLRTRREHTPAVNHKLTLGHKVWLACMAAPLGYMVISIHGAKDEGTVWSVYFLSLLLLAAINIRTGLLPDSIVQPILWLGLLFHTHSGAGPEHLYGAALGYVIPYGIYLALKTFTGKELLGQGDIKALAMSGAWFGTSALVPLFCGMLAGIVIWGVLVRLARRRSSTQWATGPAHLLASVAATWWPLWL
ncbi:A24 family peptidase [Ideonella sp. DXS29W]|uniref:A24 family peptidase n=1 Tax=Ideonella lacteola TaxID=2984193 RepID=A0ABU9BVC3_9BURK